MDLEKKLQSMLGLTDTEAAIYLACLPYQTVGAGDIANLTGIKRTTVYHAVDSLASKGFMAKKIVAGKTVFSTLSPQFLERALETQKLQLDIQKKKLRELVPELKLLQKGPLFTTDVQHFQGVAGVKAVYEEALYCKSRHWDAISPTPAFAEQFGPEFHLYLLEKRKERGISTRTLWEVEKKYARNPVAVTLKRQMRLMPKSMRGNFKSKIIIFDNKVALITPASDAGAVLISSEELHSAFQALFNTLWEISQPIVIK